MGKGINNYEYFSDFFFFEDEVGSTVKYFTDLIKNEIELSNDDITLSDKMGYNGNIMKININSTPLFKITWNLKNVKQYGKNDIKKIMDFFCVVGWGKEYDHYSVFEKYIKNKDLSTQYHDVTFYTKSWVDYITIQNSRIILQFDFEKYKKTELRILKLKRVLKKQ